MVVMGLPGSGTQAFARALKAKGWIYANEDSEHSSTILRLLDDAHRLFIAGNEEMREALQRHFKSPDAKVVVERVNATYKARSLWTDTAKQVHLIVSLLFTFLISHCQSQLGLLNVELVHLDIPKEVCLARNQKQNEKFNVAAFEELASALKPAGRKEGFTAVHVAHNQDEINALISTINNPPSASAPAAEAKSAPAAATPAAAQAP